jgi:perosamine synthetase
MCSILVESEGVRAKLREHLKGAGIETRPVFHPAHTMPVFEEKVEYPVAQYIGARGINLPSYPALTAADVNSICEAIKSFYQSA